MKKITISILVMMLITPLLVLGAITGTSTISGNPGNLNGLDFYTISNYKSVNQMWYVKVNDPADLQTKINNAQDGDIVFIPDGVYNLTSQLQINKSITVSGYSQNGTILLGSGDFNTVYINNTVTFTNLQIIMINPTTNERDTLRVEDNGKNTLIQDVTVRNPTRSGIFVTNNPLRVRINRVSVYSAGYGLAEGRGIWISSDDSVISNSYILNSSRYGIEMSFGSRMSAIDNIIDTARRPNGSSGRGYFLVTCISCTVRGGSVTNAALTGINIITSSNYTLVDGVHFYQIYGSSGNSEARAIEIQESDYVTISNNYITNVSNINTSLTDNSVGIYIESNNTYLINNIMDDVVTGIDGDTSYYKTFLQGNFIYNSTGRLVTSYTLNQEHFFGFVFNPDTRYSAIGSTRPLTALQLQQAPSPYLSLIDDGGNSLDAGGIMFDEDRSTWNGTNFEFRIRHDGSGNNLVFEDSVKSNIFWINRFSTGVNVNTSLNILNGFTTTFDGNVTINANNLIKLTANTSGMSCSATTAGALYYDSGIRKHYGCNSTAWNALY